MNKDIERLQATRRLQNDGVHKAPHPWTKEADKEMHQILDETMKKITSVLPPLKHATLAGTETPSSVKTRVIPLFIPTMPMVILLFPSFYLYRLLVTHAAVLGQIDLNFHTCGQI